MKSKLFLILIAITTFSTWNIIFNLSPATGAIKAENYGFVNEKGLLVVKPQYSEVKNFSQGLAAVKLDDKWGYIDKTGKQLVLPQYSEVKNFSQGLAAVKLDDKWGYIDKTGKVVVKPQFSEAYSFSEGVAGVTVDSNKWEYIDQTGKQAIQLQFDGSLSGWFSEGFAPVTVYEDGYPRNNGYMNKRG